MSSIYRKGRDKYFYYQTYVYNSKSGKKDKRIYHSLGTKDEQIAKEKQIEYDLKYEKKSNGTSKRSFYINTFVILFSILTLVLSLIKTRKKDLNIYFNEQYFSEQLEQTKDFDIPINKLELIEDSIEIASSKLETVKVKDNKIPSYTIEKIEVISNTFKQGKVYALVKESNNKEALLNICKTIKNTHNQFLNIIVCLYVDNELGRRAMNGENGNIQQNSWIAMYSYNEVEGEYFDDNPSGFNSYKN